MAEILKGAPVAAALQERTKKRVEVLREEGITPGLAIIRVGEKPDDVSYENSAVRRAEKSGIAAFRFTLPETASQSEIAAAVNMVNDQELIHGVLLLRPLPKSVDEESIVNLLAPEKDVDGITDGSLGALFLGKDTGFAPCTAQACLEILDYYGIDCEGKRAVVVGRSLVIGKPVSMLLLKRNATVTVCHTRTRDLAGEVRRGDIVLAAAGKQGILGEGCFRAGQIVLDVGIHFDEEGKMCGDVAFPEAERCVQAVTPVPGGVGSVTTAVLMDHVAQAAQDAFERRKF